MLPRLCRQLLTIEWLLLLLILPFAAFPTPQRVWVLLLIPLLWLVRWVGYGRPFTSTPLDWPVWGLLLMTAVGFAVSDDRLYSLPKVTGLVYATAVFYAAAAYVQAPPRRLWRLVAAQLFCGLVVVGIALFTARWTSKFEQLDAILAFTPARLLEVTPGEGGISPNEVSGVLLWVLPLAVVLSFAILRYPRTLWRQLGGWAIPASLFVWGATVVMLAVMVLTQSRAGLLGLAAGLGLMLLLAAARLRWWLAVGLVLVGLGAATAVWTSYAPQITAVLVEQSGERSIETMQGRLQIWERAITGLQEFPLTGMGINRFRVLVFDYYPTYFLPYDSDFAHAHNHLLQAGLDLGLPGLIFYVALWLGAAALAWLAWRQGVTVWRRVLGLGILCALAAYFVYGLVDAVALGAKPGFIFWLLLGLTAVLHGANVGGEALAEPVSAKASPPG
ncbi:MAG TPA: O-antigen ligase family protein [Chloroflexota bacterium]|nr:O-antigen ligase family protein [Chloroflexota bacterium]